MRYLLRPYMIFALALLGAAPGSWAQRLELAWPTPNTAWIEGKGIEAFVQPTVSGEVTSGCFGCVRSEGGQFHEGLDLFPVKRNRQGEALDSVYAIFPGVVRHVSTKAGNSSYGRYVVLEHTDVSPSVYSLYAHLASVASGLAPGRRVERGQTLGQMGRSAGGYTIPRDRAHLHLEIGVMMTRDFQSWYRARKFGSPNDHGLWNGMNLMGFDPLDFFNAFRERRIDNFEQYFSKMEPAVRFRVSTRRMPDFVDRYPSLLTKAPEGIVAGWEVAVNHTGLPFRFTPLTASELVGYSANEVRVVEFNESLLKKNRCRSLVATRRGAPRPGGDLETVIQQLFGIFAR